MMLAATSPQQQTASAQLARITVLSSPLPRESCTFLPYTSQEQKLMKVTKIRITAELQGEELSRSLPPIMKVTKHSKLKAWPKCWEASSEPTAESIGLYFFSDNMRCVAYPMHTCLFCIFSYMLV